MTHYKQRESNIELLRIISMFIIIIYHILIYSVIPNSPEKNYITKPLITVLHIGVICFVLISGYWGIKFSLKGFTKLFFYCSFYSISIYILGCLLNPEFFNLKNSINSLIPYQWWFIPVYLCLFLLIPIINIPIQNTTRGTKILYILILGIISFGFGQFIPSLSDGKNPLNFALIYYIGNYLRTELTLPVKVNAKKIFLVYLLSNISLFSVYLLSEIFMPIAGKLIYVLFFPYNGIGLIINSTLFFLVFIKLKFTSKVINWFASSALAVYLIHENIYIGSYIYNYAKRLHENIDNPILFSIVIIVFSFFILTTCILIDKIISPLFQLIIKYITSTKIFITVDKKINQQLELKK